MIVACGLPTQHTDDNLTELAFEAYREHDPTKKQPLLAELKNTYAVENIDITMIGVWDTVGSLGIPAIFGGIDMFRYSFLDTKLHPCVKNAYHAVAIDERRGAFPATLWSGPPAPGQTIEQLYFTGRALRRGWRISGERVFRHHTRLDDAQSQGCTGRGFDPAGYASYANVDAKHALDQKHESWSVRWGFPNDRDIAHRLLQQQRTDTIAPRCLVLSRRTSM